MERGFVHGDAHWLNLRPSSQTLSSSLPGCLPPAYTLSRPGRLQEGSHQGTNGFGGNPSCECSDRREAAHYRCGRLAF